MSEADGIPNLLDLINEWRKDSQFADWGLILPRRLGNTCLKGVFLFGNKSAILQPPGGDKRGSILIYADHVVVVLSPDTMSMIKATEHYRRHLKEMIPPSSNQWIPLNAADPDFFEILGTYMESMVTCKKTEE